MYPNPYGYSPYYGGDKTYKHEKKHGTRGLGQGASGGRDLKVKGASAVPRLAASDNRYKPVKVHVYKNGDALDQGIDIAVTKKMFPHWINFLDFLTTQSKSFLPVHWVYSTDGKEINSFTELENHGKYVAVSVQPFKKVEYGGVKAKNSWNKDNIIKYENPSELNSAESVELYLKKRNAESKGRRSKSVEPSIGNDSSFHNKQAATERRKARAAERARQQDVDQPKKPPTDLYKGRRYSDDDDSKENDRPSSRDKNRRNSSSPPRRSFTNDRSSSIDDLFREMSKDDFTQNYVLDEYGERRPISNDIWPDGESSVSLSGKGSRPSDDSSPHRYELGSGDSKLKGKPRSGSNSTDKSRSQTKDTRSSSSDKRSTGDRSRHGDSRKSSKRGSSRKTDTGRSKRSKSRSRSRSKSRSNSSSSTRKGSSRKKSRSRSSSSSKKSRSLSSDKKSRNKSSRKKSRSRSHSSDKKSRGSSSTKSRSSRSHTTTGSKTTGYRSSRRSSKQGNSRQETGRSSQRKSRSRSSDTKTRSSHSTSKKSSSPDTPESRRRSPVKSSRGRRQSSADAVSKIPRHHSSTQTLATRQSKSVQARRRSISSDDEKYEKVLELTGDGTRQQTRRKSRRRGSIRGRKTKSPPKSYDRVEISHSSSGF